MADISITLQKREVTGKQVKRLRREGLVPAVIHDHGKPSIIVSGVYMDVARAYRQAGKHHPVSVDADGKKYTALIKQVDLDPKKNTLTHVVFNAVTANQKVEAEIPVRVKLDEGNDSTPAERAGLIVLHNLETVEVVATPSKLPDVLEFDGEKLVEVGDVATVADLIVPTGVEVKTDAEQQIASVFEPSALAAANDAAGGGATVDDQGNVDSEHESNAEEGTQTAEIRPGGKKEYEDKEQGHHPEKK
jgi:large subunit ribosomal protein L25